MQLDRAVADDDILQRRWRRLTANPSSWYTTPPGGVGRRFTTFLAVKWRGVCNLIWNSEIPLVFTQVILTQNLGMHQA